MLAKHLDERRPTDVDFFTEAADRDRLVEMILDEGDGTPKRTVSNSRIDSPGSIIRRLDCKRQVDRQLKVQLFR